MSTQRQFTETVDATIDLDSSAELEAILFPIIRSIIKSAESQDFTLEMIEKKIKTQRTRISKYLKGKGDLKKLITLERNGLIAGCAGYGIATSWVKQVLKMINLEDIKLAEIMSVYIDPDFQGNGVGPALFREVLKEIKAKGFTHFGLYTTYDSARGFWGRHLGKPTKILKDENGLPHYVWIVDLQKFLNQ